MGSTVARIRGVCRSRSRCVAYAEALRSGGWRFIRRTPTFVLVSISFQRGRLNLKHSESTTWSSIYALRFIKLLEVYVRACVETAEDVNVLHSIYGLRRERIAILPFLEVNFWSVELVEVFFFCTRWPYASDTLRIVAMR